MPWRKSDLMSLRAEFLARLKAGERMTDLCMEYEISRKTGYKFKERFERLGLAGLLDVDRRPHQSRNETRREIRELLIAARRRYPTWGPRKLLLYVQERHPAVRFPVASTVGEILNREGLIVRRPPRRKHVPPVFRERGEALGPNDIWCADYKGQFRLRGGAYCYPLTITDHASRFILACEAFDRIDGESAKAVFADRFARYGLPKAIRTDNGAPFASRGLFGLTRLSAFWLKLGITPQRIEPGKPQQNGRHERMHRTLKADATRPASANILRQQERFDDFIDTFNCVRPHEALDQKTPATVYASSARPFVPGGELEYPLHDDVRKVDPAGHIRILRGRRHQAVFVATALAGERVGIRELESDRWLVSFASLDLGDLDTRIGKFFPADVGNPAVTRLLPG